MNSTSSITTFPECYCRGNISYSPHVSHTARLQQWHDLVLHSFTIIHAHNGTEIRGFVFMASHSQPQGTFRLAYFLIFTQQNKECFTEVPRHGVLDSPSKRRARRKKKTLFIYPLNIVRGCSQRTRPELWHQVWLYCRPDGINPICCAQFVD